MRRFLVTAAAALALAPGAAEAATATTADGNLRYTAVAGEVNNVTFQRVSTEVFRVTDVGTTVTAGTGCTQESPNVVTCTTASGRPIIASLGDQDDRAASRTSRSVQLFGEDGNDRLAGASGRDRLEGGPGDDNVTGGSGRDRLTGGGGNDSLNGGSGNDFVEGSDGNDLIAGGSGNDALRGGNGLDTLSGDTGNDSVAGGNDDDTLREGSAPNGGDSLAGDSGSDTVDYGARTAPVNVAVDDVNLDGDRRSTERDNVRSTVDRVIGGAGSDALIGRDGATDTLIGGAGDDVIEPRRGEDHVDGGPGIDQIRLRDLSRDDVVCGGEEDSVAADERDTTGTDCENVRRTASMSIAASGTPSYPTVMLRLACPPTAFKFCAGRVIIRTLGKVQTRAGKRQLTIGVRRFLIATGGEKVIGVRIRAGARRYIGRGLGARAELSAYDGAGPARKDAIRLRLRP